MADEQYFQVPGSEYQARTASGADSIARLLMEQEFNQQRQQMEQQQKMQLQQQDYQQRALLAQGPYATSVNALMRDANDYATNQNPLWALGAALPQAAGEAMEGENPWLGAIVRGLAGGAGQGIRQNSYASRMEEVKPLYKKLFELSQTNEGVQEMMTDPQLAPYAQPFVLQQLGQMAKNTDRSGETRAGLDKFRGEMEIKKEFGELQSQRGMDDLASMQPLTPAQKMNFSTQLSVAPELLNTVGDVDRFVRVGNFKGEKTRPPSPAELSQIANAERFDKTIGELQGLAGAMADDSGAFLGNAQRRVNSYLDPSSSEYKYYALLKSAQQEYARARDSGALSNQDVSRYDPLFMGSPWLESKADIQTRLSDILKRGQDSRAIALNTLKTGQVNVDGFLNQLPQASPAPTPTPTPAPGGQPNATGQQGAPQGFTPTGKTSGGKPVYSNGSQLWVPD
jgi:hypothetical protein